MSNKSLIIDGKEISQSLLAQLKERIIANNSCIDNPPCLAIILVGDNKASHLYVKNKILAASNVGIKTRLIELDSSILEQDLLKTIIQLNQDSTISGIIAQLPLPKHIREWQVIMAIDPCKDVDGFHPVNSGLLHSGYDANFVPCTAMGVLALIKSCISDLSGKTVAMIGRSNIVGKPLAALLLKENCTVTLCHSKTENLSAITATSNIVISAIGNPKILTKKYFNQDALVIDVGINRISIDGKNKFVGDVDFANVANHVKYITPVPGGVGPMTVAYLLINTYKAYLMRTAHKIVD